MLKYLVRLVDKGLRFGGIHTVKATGARSATTRLKRIEERILDILELNGIVVVCKGWIRRDGLI